MYREMLRIIVSIKQVPDADDLRIDPITNNLVREGVSSVINPPENVAYIFYNARNYYCTGTGSSPF